MAARGKDAAADNVSTAPLFRTVTHRVPQPPVGELLPAYSDEFTKETLPAAPWQWIGGPAAGVTMTGTALSWPTQNAELADSTNTASVLVREAPPGDYTVETKITFAPMFGAPTANTMGLRLTHHHDPTTNETEVQANTSRDGSRWVPMGVWTLPTRTPMKSVWYR